MAEWDTSSHFVHTQVDDDEALLRIPESVGSGIMSLVMGAMLFGAFAYVHEEDFAMFSWLLFPLIALCGYVAISKFFGHVYFYVSANSLASWQRPFPRRRRRVIVGDIAALSFVGRNIGATPTKAIVATEAMTGDAVVLAELPDDWSATAAIRAIMDERARLGAPIHAWERGPHEQAS